MKKEVSKWIKLERARIVRAITDHMANEKIEKTCKNEVFLGVLQV